MPKKNSNLIIVDLTVFCANCHSMLRLATYNDMTGDADECPDCGPTQIDIGLSVRTATEELLRYAQQEMMKHQKDINKLLSERSRSIE